MGDIYASAIGTTVLQLKEIPPRPSEFDGAVILFGLANGVQERIIRAALDDFGKIISCKVESVAIVRFDKHDAALAVKRASEQGLALLTNLCKAADTLYNERSYDGRTGEPGRDDDLGRGWCVPRSRYFERCGASLISADSVLSRRFLLRRCCFEGAVSSELVMRLGAYPRMRSALEALKPKMISLQSNEPPKAVPPLLNYESCGRQWVTKLMQRIRQATFTGNADSVAVPHLYVAYVEKIANTLQSTLSLTAGDNIESRNLNLPLAPEISWQPAALPRLAAGQLILVLAETSARRNGGEGHLHIGMVDDERRVVLPLAAHTMPLRLELEHCSQAVLPWNSTDNAMKVRQLRVKVQELQKFAPARDSFFGTVGQLKQMCERLSNSAPLNIYTMPEPAQCSDLAKLAIANLKEVAEQPFGARERSTVRKALDGEMELMSAVQELDGSLERVRMAHRKQHELEQRMKEAAQQLPRARHELELAQEDLQADPMAKQQLQLKQAVVDELEERIKSWPGRKKEIQQKLREINDQRTKEAKSFIPQLDDLERLVKELDVVNLEDAVTQMVREAGVSGVRQYAVGQQLTFRLDNGSWTDAKVTEVAGIAHTLRVNSSSKMDKVQLHPWNHAPREMPQAAFDELHAWWVATLRTRHTDFVDPLSGVRLNVLQQCIAVRMVCAGEAAYNEQDLAGWLCNMRTQNLERAASGASAKPSALLLTGAAAAGKTSLMSQLVLGLLSTDGEVVPIMIRLQQLQQRLLQNQSEFTSAWNWVDAFLRIEYASQPAVYRYLRQAMYMRRAVLLLDGLDEGGKYRQLIERHVAETLLQQGHVIFATSRPAGISDERFATFHRLELQMLSSTEQTMLIKHRVGNEAASELCSYVEKEVPPNSRTGELVSSNPLMLSMIISIFELRQGISMPGTVAELYEAASQIMLARTGLPRAEIDHFTTLLQVCVIIGSRTLCHKLILMLASCRCKGGIL